MIHTEGARERRVGFDNYTVLGAEGCDVCPGVEGVDFDLVDCWSSFRGGVEQFL